MDIPERPRRKQHDFFTDLVEGLRYVAGHPALRALLLLALLPVVLGMPYMTMLTVFARDVLEVGGSGLGLLTACASMGAMLGAVYVTLSLATPRGRLMLGALVVFGLTLAAFALSPWVGVSALALFGVGFSQQVYLTTNQTVVQEHVDEAYRGRVLSILFLNRGMMPLGTMLAGFGTAAFGVQPTVTAMAVALVATALLAIRFAPAARDLD